MTSTHQSLVDALPYIDHEYNDPEIRAAVRIDAGEVCVSTFLLTEFPFSLLGLSNGRGRNEAVQADEELPGDAAQPAAA